MNTPTLTQKKRATRRGPARAAFRSLLYPPDAADTPTLAAAPDYFEDLRLDAIASAITAGRDDHNLEPFFWTRLTDLAGVAYRQQVFRDLERQPIRDAFAAFAKAMASVRVCLGRARRSHHRWEGARWYLDGASVYCRAVSQLDADLRAQASASQGITDLAGFLAQYVGSGGFEQLADEAQTVKTTLADLRYRLRIKGDRVIVSRHRDEPDYGAEVLATFAKFQQDEGTAYEFEFPARIELNHVETAVLDRVAQLHRAEFGALADFVERHPDFADPVLTRLDREAGFYLAYLEHVDRLARPGLSFCLPEVADQPDHVYGRDVFDLALARSLSDDTPLVPNDFELTGPERIVVISGPNQGGKTTFARTIGQLHHLAALGVPVPGSAVRLELVDHVFAHFERVEEVEDMAGKLEDELRRMRDILEQATGRSLLVMNESFSSTTLTDQLLISKWILGTVIERRTLAMVVTFLDELAALGPETVSMVSQVDPEEPARRTFRIVRRPADGLAYALALADKHRLTYDDLKRRLGR